MKRWKPGENAFCENCRYFSVGECRFNAPTSCNYWPKVTPGSYCWDWCPEDKLAEKEGKDRFVDFMSRLMECADHKKVPEEEIQ